LPDTVVREITLGGDPEFLIEEISSGQFAYAESVLSNPSTRAMIGVDGCSSTGEIRIPPQKSFIGIFKSMKDIICTRLPRELDLKKYKITAGSGKFAATGGHIHFGGIGTRPSREMLRNIDRFIRTPLNEVSNTSRRQGYGHPEDFETKSWGGYEARSPLSWIVSPKITKGVYAISEILAHHGVTKEINTNEELLTLADNKQKRAIESYWRELKWFKDKQRKLEEVDVYKAWTQKGKHISASCSKLRIGFFPVQFSSRDFNMRNIFDREDHMIPQCRLRIYFTGRSRTHDETEAVYIPDLYEALLIKMPKLIFGVPVKTWEHPHFGLSYALRENVEKSTKIVIFIVYTLNRIMKHRSPHDPPIPFL
jgi:hypothetical protein